jgi:enamine deaminase RidA (YjgF/YER057c/UK114 family)
MSAVEQRLADLGVVLPPSVPPVANFVPFVQSGNLLFISGQICLSAERKVPVEFQGKLGGGVSDENGRAAARLCAVNLLAQVKVALGNLDRVVRCVRLSGFINAAPDYTALPQVMNGASDLIVEAFGDKGRHARIAVGVATLPANCAVEVEGIFEVE